MLPSRLQNAVGPLLSLLSEVSIQEIVQQHDTLLGIAQRMQTRFIEDSKHEAVGMLEIIQRATDWES